jgi:hypothetical protein
MSTFLNSLLEKWSNAVDKSYVVISLLLSLFIFVYLSSSIYLHFSDEYQNCLFLIGADITVYDVLYLVVFLFLQAITICLRTKKPNAFYALYFSLIFGFSLLFTDLFLYDDLTTTIILTLLFIIISTSLVIQRKHFVQSFKKLSLVFKVLVIIFSILNYFFISNVVFMGQRLTVILPGNYGNF